MPALVNQCISIWYKQMQSDFRSQILIEPFNCNGLSIMMYFPITRKLFVVYVGNEVLELLIT